MKKNVIIFTLGFFVNCLFGMEFHEGDQKIANTIKDLIAATKGKVVRKVDFSLGLKSTQYFLSKTTDDGFVQCYFSQENGQEHEAWFGKCSFGEYYEKNGEIKSYSLSGKEAKKCYKALRKKYIIQKKDV